MRKTIATVGIAAAVITASTGFALAAQATPTTAPPAKALACVEYGKAGVKTAAGNFMLWDWNRSACPKGTYPVSWGSEGASGPAGPSGVVSTVTKDLGGKASVATGGSFATNATEAGEVSLPAGTYLLSVAAKATPTMTSAVQVFPAFAVYNQAANASFTGDLINVGSGALESGGNTNIDSYYDGSSTVTLTSATTLHVYAFGYDSDRGAGAYALDDLTVTATQVTPAG
jgi:hypothetical protein